MSAGGLNTGGHHQPETSWKGSTETFATMGARAVLVVFWRGLLLAVFRARAAHRQLMSWCVMGRRQAAGGEQAANNAHCRFAAGPSCR
ncbi:hypothetical protein LMH87_000798 [Akanthomyces muscarius]|uniref:Uncharacterized protein n=1 Tax=Akanthomyces muscarius TaxID=2231603 RepID=A0A9W8QG43_AKAMU|nr:hypothetical protein LMH87_000798 [Akanthomyces muscarius]KAJ4155559.1 hypothetical protein LMH87_000798 [Akanthomyces muscarius]